MKEQHRSQEMAKQVASVRKDASSSPAWVRKAASRYGQFTPGDRGAAEVPAIKKK